MLQSRQKKTKNGAKIRFGDERDNKFFDKRFEIEKFVPSLEFFSKYSRFAGIFFSSHDGKMARGKNSNIIEEKKPFEVKIKSWCIFHRNFRGQLDRRQFPKPQMQH